MNALEAIGNPDSDGTPSPRARLLLAEDDSELRDLLACVLRASGHEVVEAQNGEELWSLLHTDILGGGGHFALVVSDVRMPGLTAFDVLSKLQGSLSNTPVIVITAFGDQTTHMRALRLGACRVFDKPFECDDLCAAVQETLSKRRPARRAC
ncbi:MAG: response regulator [Pseudomonadota bacterium]